jgi:hypothetical protein
MSAHLQMHTDMTTDRNRPEEEKKDAKEKVRDLPPKKDVKGGDGKTTERKSGRTVEIDFMNGCD